MAHVHQCSYSMIVDRGTVDLLVQSSDKRLCVILPVFADGAVLTSWRHADGAVLTSWTLALEARKGTHNQGGRVPAIVITNLKVFRSLYGGSGATLSVSGGQSSCGCRLCKTHTRTAMPATAAITLAKSMLAEGFVAEMMCV